MGDVQDDGLIRTPDLSVRVSVFEGPLDLLLFLIRKNELDIHDIPIESVTRQYMDILHGMERMDLEVAGEFFVMAATLMQIKSRMLLPRDARPAADAADAGSAEADLDPRWELVQQLLEYRKFKEASVHLSELVRQAQDMLPRLVHDAGAEPGEAPLGRTDAIALWNTFNNVLRRLADRMDRGSIRAESVTVAGRMAQILELLRKQPRFTFSSLFPAGGGHTLAELIATFLALLELARLKRITLRQDELFDEIHCERRDDDGDAPGQAPTASEFDEPPAAGE